MIVCHCRGLTDRDVRRLAETGQLALQRPTGTTCGGCHPLVRQIASQAKRSTGAGREPIAERE